MREECPLARAKVAGELSAGGSWGLPREDVCKGSLKHTSGSGEKPETKAHPQGSCFCCGGSGGKRLSRLSPKLSCKVLLKGRQRWVGGRRSGPVGGGVGGEASPRGEETQGTCHLMEAESWGGWALGGPGRSHPDWTEGESAGVASGHRDLRPPPHLSQLPGLPVWDPSLPAASQPGGRFWSHSAPPRPPRPPSFPPPGCPNLNRATSGSCLLMEK